MQSQLVFQEEKERKRLRRQNLLQILERNNLHITIQGREYSYTHSKLPRSSYRSYWFDDELTRAIQIK